MRWPLPLPRPPHRIFFASYRSGAAALRQPIRQASMAGAIREAAHRLVAAKCETRRSWIAQRPPACALGKLDQRARLDTRDDCASARFARDRGSLRNHQPQKLALRRLPRAAGAGRASARRTARGPPRRQSEPMNFADHGIAGNADLGGDFAAGQPVPTQVRSCSMRSAVQVTVVMMGWPHLRGGRSLGRPDRAKAAQQRPFFEIARSKAQNRCAPAHSATFTEPHLR